MGAHKAKEYVSITGMQLHTVTSPLVFCFGDGEKRSEGAIEIRIPCPTGKNIEGEVHVVREAIHLLIGMEVICSEKLVLDFRATTIRKQGQRW